MEIYKKDLIKNLQERYTAAVRLKDPSAVLYLIQAKPERTLQYYYDLSPL